MSFETEVCEYLERNDITYQVTCAYAGYGYESYDKFIQCMSLKHYTCGKTNFVKGMYVLYLRKGELYAVTPWYPGKEWSLKLDLDWDAPGFGVGSLQVKLLQGWIKEYLKDHNIWIEVSKNV